MLKKFAISLILGTAISLVTLYLAFRNVPLQDLIAYLWSINYLWVIPSVLVSLSTYALRTVRWQFILASSYRVGFWQAFSPMVIGFMMNCILPARVGEVARPLVLQKQQGVPFSAGLATVAVERVFDAVSLLGLFAVVLMVVPLSLIHI